MTFRQPRIIQPQTRALVTVVGCVHGDEHFGLRVQEMFEKQQGKLPGAQFILANPEATAANRRFLDKDLNRCFPGKPDGNREERLADALLPHLKASQFVLDIHTTSSPIRMTPIVTNLGNETKWLLNLCDSVEVALIKPPLDRTSLIGQCEAGLSLEYNEDEAEKPEALDEIMDIMEAIVHGAKRPAQKRKIFHVTRGVGDSDIIPDDAQNFEFCAELNGYPFLLKERAYPKGLLANKMTNEWI